MAEQRVRPQAHRTRLVVGTTNEISDGLDFRAYGIEADNFTDSWVEIPGVGRFVAPQSSRTIRLDGPAIARARFGAPGTTANPAGKAGQVCTLVFTETELPTTGSPSVSQSVAITQAPSTIFAAFAQLRARTDAAGDVTIAGPTTIDLPVKFYRDLTIAAGVTLSAGGRLQIVVARNIIFGSAASRVSAAALGYLGGSGFNAGTFAGNPGNGFDGSVLTDTTIFGIGGAIGPGAGGAGGAGGATRVARLLSYIAALYSNQYPWGAVAGGGGGSGGACTANFGQQGGAGGAGSSGGGAGGSAANNNNNTSVSTGGSGGGVLIIVCDDVQTSAGLMDADGGDGTANSGVNGGGAGGGGGGMVVLFPKTTLTNVPVVRANGGAGGAGSGGSGTGGPGGAGIATMIQLT